ncbi:SurA N-terminal domain-containing protein [Desulfonatronovibrio magnus]|uniref:SurA N-terminal domain-containing protein n=1 Tax=Desulfonatronovibrio magnus TaxID=698827 RepID=UPI0005EAF5BF|nr:SurA N-terminal domain-containing protein [Desulfonatronovibrio magnus]
MLDVLRDNAQSWIVKLLFAVIVIVFVFWGVGSFTGDRDGVLAIVNDEPILINDFIRAYETTAQNVREQNPDLTAADLREMQFRQQIFNQLLNSTLLLQKSRELGLQVSRSELQREITQLPAFLREDNQFDPELYQGILRAHHLTPAEFERDFQNNLLMQKMEEYVALPSRPNPREVQDFFNYIRSQAKVDYLKVSWSDFEEDLEISQEDIEAHYRENQSRFMVPEKIKISYLQLTPRALAPMQDVSSDEIEEYYRANLAEYTTPEEVRASHILVTLAQDASQDEQDEAKEKITAISARLQDGEDFAELAMEHSQCPSASQGGDLGTFGRGRMVPEFEDAVFNLEAGEISEPVKTQFGWHIIKLHEYIPEGTQELDEVRASIRMELGADKAMDELADIMDDILEILLTGGTLDEAAQRLNLDTRTTDFFSMQDGPRDLDLPSTAINQLFNMTISEVTETPVMIEQGYVFAEKIDARDAKVRDLEEVQDDIVNTLTRQKAMEMARERAAEYLASINEDDMEGDINASLESSSAFDRQGFIPGLGMSPDIALAAFAAGEGQWLPEVYRIGNGYVIARVSEIILPDPEKFEQEKDQWVEHFAQMQKQQAFQSFVNMLRNQARIRILRPDIIDS